MKKNWMWMIIVSAAFLAILVYWQLSPAANTSLKSSDEISVEEIEPAAKSVVDSAIAAIKAKNPKSLLVLMANRDEVVFATYREEFFKGEAFLPAKVTGARKLNQSSLGGMNLIVHSVPRERDYEFTLVSRNGKYLIKGIR